MQIRYIFRISYDQKFNKLLLLVNFRLNKFDDDYSKQSLTVMCIQYKAADILVVKLWIKKQS